MPVQMFALPHHIELVEFELKDQGFTPPNKIIVAAIINYEPMLLRYLHKFYKPTGVIGGLDTAERELLLDALTRFYLGDDRCWPCNGDGPAVMKQFVEDLTGTITKAGWILVD